MAEEASGAAGYPHIQALLDRIVANREVAGATAAVKAADAPLAFLFGGTIALDSEIPMGPDAICRIASMTKPVTSLAALLLVEDGRLGLDQPIAEVAPEFADMRVAVGPDPAETVPARTPITVRHLMTCTAGIPHVWQEGPVSDAYRRRGLDFLGNFRLMPARGDELPPPGTLDEFGARIAGLPLAAEPGTQWIYGLSLDVLGLVVQRASGMPFEEFLGTRIFAPLGMADTAFFVPAGKFDRFTTNYAEGEGGLVVQDGRAASAFATPPGAPSGGAGLVSMARDYARFCQMLTNEGELDGVRIARPETVRTGRTNMLADTVERPDFVLDGADWGAGVAIATPRSAGPDGLRVGAYGWTGGVGGTTFWIDPATRTYVVWMMQRQMSAPDIPLHRELHAAARQDFEMTKG